MNPFNPCSIENPEERVAAKLWELLRRNRAFCDSYHELRELAGQPREAGQERQARHREREHHFLKEEFAKSELAGLALAWLIPDPVFRVKRIERAPKGEAHMNRVIEVGEGTTPDTSNRKTWRWAASNHLLNLQPGAWRRGPVVAWQTDQAHPLAWKTGPFAQWALDPPAWNLKSPWDELPSGFQWDMLGAASRLLRSTGDSQKATPLSSAGVGPHESEFFTSWDLAEFRRAGTAKGEPPARRQAASGAGDNLNVTEYARLKWFRKLGKDYRVFAIPRAPYTSKEAAEIGRWLATALYSSHDPVVTQLALNILLGNERDWASYLDYEAGGARSRQLPSAFYKSLRYIRRAIAKTYPELIALDLFAPSSHRQRRRYTKKAEAPPSPPPSPMSSNHRTDIPSSVSPMSPPRTPPSRSTGGTI